MAKYFQGKAIWSIPRDGSKPIYRQIEDLIVRNIRSGVIVPGQALPSYPWLSKTLGVADKTVRQAYAALQQAGVVSIQSGRGTFVARRGAEGACGGAAEDGTLGLLLPSRLQTSLADPSWRTAQGVLDAAMEIGLSVVVGDLGGAERMAGRYPKAGVVLLARPGEAVWGKLMVLPMPKVWAGGGGVEDLASIELDYEMAGRECVYKLVGVGHRRIGLLRPARHAGADAFERGVGHALGTAGLTMDPTLVQAVDLEAGETGWTAAAGLLETELTGTIVFGEALLSAFSEAAWRRGRAVPATVSVVAVRTVPGPAWAGGVAVDAVVLDPAEVGRRAVRWLQERPSAARTRVERVAPVWLAGQSLASPVAQ